MPAIIPPWLDVSPEQFTRAAIAGGQQGYEAAAQAGQLAQNSALSIAKLAQEAANRAAQIRVQREQIAAELARNSANVAAARYNAALDYSQAQNALNFAREREANAVAESQLQREAQLQIAGDENALKRELGLARINTPETYAPTEFEKLVNKRDELNKAGNAAGAAEFDAVINNFKTRGDVSDTAKFRAESQAAAAAVKRANDEVSRWRFNPEKLATAQDNLQKALAIQEQLFSGGTNAPATAAPGALRYQLINGQLQLVR